MPLVYDLADPLELQGFVRNIPTPAFQLAQWLPATTIDDIEYRFIRGSLVEQDVAPFRAFDAEAPIGTRGGLARSTGELPPISKKMRLGEEQRLRLRSLLGARGQERDLVASIFDDAANLTRSVLARFELARGQALTTGKVTIAENGVAAEADYGYVAAQFRTADDPDGAGGTAAGVGYVDDPAYPLIDTLERWADEYETRSGARPGVLLTSRRARNALLRNTEVATLAATVAGAPQRVTAATLDAVLGEYDLPPIRTYEATVRVGGVQTRVIPPHLGLFLPDTGAQLGRTFFGVTAEALELADARQIAAEDAAGLTAVVDKTFDPVALWTKVAAIGIPTIINPELVSVLTLLAP